MTRPPSSRIQEVHDAAVDAHMAGQLDEAAHGYREVITLKPDHPDALQALSLLARDRGDGVLALHLIERAAAAVDHPRILVNLGRCRAALGDWAGAEAAYTRGLEIAPDDPVVLSALLTLNVDLQRFEAAAIYNDRLLRLNPNMAQLQNNQGGFAHINQQFKRAAHHYHQAIRLDPENRDARLNLASLYIETGRPDLSEIEALKVLAFAPDDPRARLALSHARLGQGKWAEAWPDYEFRLTAWVPEPDFKVPRWRGEPVRGKRLLVIGEQGLGDNIQFARYGALLKASGAERVIFAVQDELVRLLRHMGGIDQVAGAISGAEAADFWTPLLSLPLHFGTTPETVRDTLGSSLPYIRLPPPSGVRLAQAGAPLQVGIFWAGGQVTAPTLLTRADAQRSLTPDQALTLLFAPELEGRVQWTLLQKDRRPDYLTTLAQMAGWRDPFGDADFAARADLLDTAEIIAGLDLVIGVDSALIHLSGALGRPTWMMDRLNHCWRWKRGASDSDWYPDVFRIFRQTVFGDWTPVLADVRDALTAMASPRS